MILFVLESHGALHFGGGIDETAQRIAGQRVVITASVYIFEFQSFVVGAFRFRIFEKKSFNLICGIQGVAVFLMESGGKSLEHAADIGGVGFATFVDDFAKHKYLA